MSLPRNRVILSKTMDHRLLGKDKGLARLGDSITNLVYSLAISLIMKRPEGLRASDRILSQALTEAGLRYMAPRRARSGDLGDVAESLIASAWLRNMIDIEDAASLVASEFNEEDLKDRKKGDLSAIKGLKKLLNNIMEQIDQEAND